MGVPEAMGVGTYYIGEIKSVSIFKLDIFNFFKINVNLQFFEYFKGNSAIL